MLPRPAPLRRAAAAVLALAAFAGLLRAADASRPNIVLIFADDLGYADLGSQGAKDIATPHLDRLAAEGTRFTSFYVAQAVCTASRAALLTGQYPNRIGMSGALNHTSTAGISPRERLLSERLKEVGYATAAFGKWHLGHQPPFLPTRRGFDEWMGIPYSNDNGPLHPVTKGIPSLPLYDGEEVIEADPDQSRFTARFTERAVAFIERNRERPFFLYLPHVMPHVPIFASEKFRGSSRRGAYGDVVQELDAGVGEVLAALRRHGLEERTIVIFTSDNGPFLSYGEHAGLATPLREGKLTTFEGGMRTPFLIRWPGRIPAGRVSDEPLSTLDLSVTLGALAGAPRPPGATDGTDLSPLLLGQPGARGRGEFWFYSGDELHAVRLGDWKLHVPHDYLTVAAEPGRGGKPSNWANMKPDSIENSGIRGIASRHGYRVERLGLALYDVRRDPGETMDVAAANPEIVARLQARVAAARADLGDSLTGAKGANVRAAGEFRQPLPAGVRRIANQTYHSPREGNVLLDLYLPEKAPASPLPVVVWVHGGGWSKGSKENPPLSWLAAEGYAVVSINYRLSWLARWPAQNEDVRAAVRWLRTHAARHGLDPARIAIAGGSAGGHLAALAGTQAPPAGETVSSRVRAVIDLYGPSDLPSMPANRPDHPDEDIARTNGARLLGGPVRDRLELAREASPLHHVSAGDPPFLILHGDRDPLVPLEQSRRLHEALRAAGVASELVVLPGAGHGGKEFSTPEIRARIRTFLADALR